jgi:hypothetical protein
MMIARMSPSGQVRSAQPLTLNRTTPPNSLRRSPRRCRREPSKQGHAKSDRRRRGRHLDPSRVQAPAGSIAAVRVAQLEPIWAVRSVRGGPGFGLALAESPKPIRDGIYYFRPHSPHLSPSLPTPSRDIRPRSALLRHNAAAAARSKPGRGRTSLSKQLPRARRHVRLPTEVRALPFPLVYLCPRLPRHCTVAPAPDPPPRSASATGGETGRRLPPPLVLSAAAVFSARWGGLVSFVAGWRGGFKGTVLRGAWGLVY